MKKRNGFTLLELLVVVAIVGIVLTVARTSYLNYQIKVNRVNAQAELLDISQRLQEYKMLNKTYAGLNPLGVGNSKTFPEGVTKPYYTLSLGLAQSDQTFTLTATPVRDTRQQADGVICLNSESQKFWSAGATSCALSDTSVWYGD